MKAVTPVVALIAALLLAGCAEPPATSRGSEEGNVFLNKAITMEVSSEKAVYSWNLGSVPFNEWLTLVSRSPWETIYKETNGDFHFAAFRYQDRLITWISPKDGNHEYTLTGPENSSQGMIFNTNLNTKIDFRLEHSKGYTVGFESARVYTVHQDFSGVVDLRIEARSGVLHSIEFLWKSFNKNEH